MSESVPVPHVTRFAIISTPESDACFKYLQNDGQARWFGENISASPRIITNNIVAFIIVVPSDGRNCPVAIRVNSRTWWIARADTTGSPSGPFWFDTPHGNIAVRWYGISSFVKIHCGRLPFFLCRWWWWFCCCWCLLFRWTCYYRCCD